ncbi:MAG: type I DNA topoisomerase [Dongiaceae bacterium]
MNVVVVESPSKAKTIGKYLGPEYRVLASFGHVRDLPAKDGSVRPDEDFAMSWIVDERGDKRIDEIAKALKTADRLILATDPDREGEAISWHICEALRERGALKSKPVERVVFNEITRRAVQEAMLHPRELDNELVDAYRARRALDYLVGFTLSPVLWRKLPGSRSAGRVQSVALRLISEREAEIEAFRPREYWSVAADLAAADGTAFEARLTHLDGKKLDKFDLANKDAAGRAVTAIRGAAPFSVSNVERKTIRRNPAAPFTTSTLQQEASRKLGFGTTRTMRLAQRLYEGVDIDGETVGLITYMRTDGVQIAGEALAATRELIGSRHGKQYLPERAREYRATAKNAQEAHEAIRPTDVTRSPDRIARLLERDEARLYELIWKRLVASQMESAVFDQVAVDIDGASGVTLRANGSVLKFDGFLTLYREDEDDPSEDESEGGRLPDLNKGDRPALSDVRPEQHFTQPPPRYSEASLVKKLEELGIGRPSTYASIIQVLQDRNYVRIDKKRFIPEDRGRLVVAFLTEFFQRYVEYGFTADLESQLDDISGGRINWKQVLRDFWEAFHTAVEGTRELTITQVIDALDQALGSHFFPEKVGDGPDPRVCPGCGKGRLSLKLGKFGAFIGCSQYPECRFTRPLAPVDPNGGEMESGPKELGKDPATDKIVTMRKGPYGIYVQLGETSPEKGAEKPKRVSLPPNLTPDDIDLDTARALLALPREIGTHPESGEPIVAGIGRFGPYLKHGAKYKTLPKDENILAVGINRAVDLLAQPGGGRGGRGPAAPAKTIGNHPEDGKPVTLHEGRYGPYVKHGKVNATLPRDVTPDSVTLDEAVRLIAERTARQPGGRGRGGGRSKAKSAAKSATAPKTKTKAKVKAAAKTKSTAGVSRAKRAPAAEGSSDDGGAD